MTRIAISHWQGRISPVFDVSEKLLLIDLIDNIESAPLDVTLNGDSVSDRSQRICELGVNTLICGAISWPLEFALTNAGVEVFSHTCGDVDQVLNAFRTGCLQQAAFRMPGTGQGKRRFCRNRCSGGRWGLMGKRKQNS